LPLDAGRVAGLHVGLVQPDLRREEARVVGQLSCLVTTDPAVAEKFNFEKVEDPYEEEECEDEDDDEEWESA
jgi:hypothetical protein